MAITPNPRSRSQILGSLVEGFCSDYGINNLKVGGPILSIFDAVSQSQFRNSEDIFTLLEADSLDFAERGDLDNIGNSENVPRFTESPAFGPCIVADTAFQKVGSTIYQGIAAPIVGSVTINIANGAGFPNTGSVYLGRATSNYEGAIPYTSIVNNGSYWTLTLSTGTQRFHNLGETVILAQGGNRPVNAGATCQTFQSGAVAATQFTVLYGTKIPDGETSITGITVVCTKPGIGGNVSLGAINSFVSVQPATLTITNSVPFNNGQATEDDDTYRERIRAARKTRVKGTPLAIQTAAVGTLSPVDNKRVLSAAFVTGVTGPSTLYIDDGTGYEETSIGVAIESLIDLAFGGEQDFKVSSQPPITKAAVISTLSAPFTLADGMNLAFAIGGVTTQHTVSAGEFRAIGNATGYELVASINANPNLLWSARTLNSGTQVVVVAKADSNESIQNVPVTSGIDANQYLGFPSRRVDTTRLYKNDRLLSKDGSLAIITSNPVSTWATLVSPLSLVIMVDGITLKFDGTMFPKFQDSDFAAYTSFATIQNNPAAWAAVFSARIPGVTAAVSNGLLTLTSNRGLLGAASVAIQSSDLVSNRMFNLGSAVGANNDYEVNRNTGELQLVKALAAGDTLSLGSLSTRAFVQTPAISSVVLSANANLWFSIDGGSQIIGTSLSSSAGINISQTAKTWGYRTRITSFAGSAVFTNVQLGDWAVCWDPALISAGLNGAYRVAAVDAAFTWLEIETAATVTTGTNILLTRTGLQIVRSVQPLQRIVVPTGTTYTSSSFVTTLNGFLRGANASVYKTTMFRVKTNTFNDVANPVNGVLSGDIALVAADSAGQTITLPLSSAVTNLTGHMASVESAGPETGTPDFHATRVVSAASSTAPTIAWSVDPTGIDTQPGVGSQIVGLRVVDDGTTAILTRYGSNKSFRSPLLSVTSSAGNWALSLERGVDTAWVPQDRAYMAQPYSFTSNDTLTVLVDGNVSSKRYGINMWRTFKPVGNVYGSTNTFTDTDNGGQSIAVGFGLNFSFNDFAVWMAARGITNSADNTRSALWRYFRLGPDGNQTRVQYQNPSGPNAPVGSSILNNASGTTDIGITLSSGALRTGYTVRGSSQIGYAVTSVASGLASITYVLGFTIASGTRLGTAVTLTLTMPGGIAGHGLVNGNIVYVKSLDPNYPSGSYAITGTTGTTITYSDGTTVGGNPAFASTGDVSFDSAGEVTLLGSPVTAGDFFVMAGNPFNATAPTMRIAAVNAQNFTGSTPSGGGTVTTVQWMASPLGNPANFQIFQNPAQTASAVIAAFNAVAGAPLQGTILGTGAGILDRSSDELAAASPTWVSLSDGANSVAVTTAPGTMAGNYQLTFKNPIAAGLATGADWQDEVVKVMPRTAQNTVDWLNSPTVSGLFTACEVVTSSVTSKVQLASLTPGSAGSLQVQGGGANSATASVLGSSTIVATNFMISTIAAVNAGSFSAGHFVRIDNATTLTKTVFDLNTKLNSVALVGSNVVLVLDPTSTPVYTPSVAASPSVGLLIERQGNFVALTDTGLASAIAIAGVSEGDWIRLATPASPILDATRRISATNTGIFRVVRVVAASAGTGGACVWVENLNVFEQPVAEADVQFFKYNSLLPGDTVSISAPLWGAGNAGKWTVTSVGDAGSGQYTNQFTFKLSATKTPQTISSPVGALGSQAGLVLAIEGTPGRYFKRIYSIAPNSLNNSFIDLKFTTSAGAGHINASAGSVLTALDKLGFSTAIAQGIDGYQYSTGLMGEVNRVLYGDPSDPATYPGYVAAGALVNTSGPFVKRITLSLQLRVRSGASRKDISEQAQSAVAAIVNQSGQGIQPAYVDIQEAAKVPGVISVVVLGIPAGADVISVQPFEKPLVLNPSTDILISYLG